MKMKQKKVMKKISKIFGNLLKMMSGGVENGGGYIKDLLISGGVHLAQEKIKLFLLI
jgi:hypothetical protein